MYELYKEQIHDPVKFGIYRKEFYTAFNLSFHKPKKDQCDRCVPFKQNKNPTSQEIDDFKIHEDDKLSMKAERALDRKNVDRNVIIVCFDLQSVFSLPKGNASSFYYKRKLSVYNMTATVCFANKPKITYCALWTEAHSGRTGDDIASAVAKILENILIDNPETKKIILWSDSCVAQNKNKVMSTALLYLLHQAPKLKTIIQKFSAPGHTLVQEVDCVYSVIDTYFKNMEIYSPLSLLNHLKNMSYQRVHLRLIEMQPEDFKSYSVKAGQLNFSIVPFTKVKFIKYEKQDLLVLHIKTNCKDVEFKTVILNKKPTNKVLGTPNNLFSQNLSVIQNRTKSISKDKISDIKSLLAFMPQVDHDYYKALFNF